MVYNPSSLGFFKADIAGGKVSLEMISKDSYLSFFYAMDIIKGRFPEGEEAISKDGYYSYAYARDVLKGRFELGELAIKANDFYISEYLRLMKNFLNKDEYIEFKLDF